ncbi:hypothetical protein FHS18_004949 [Paenibacillus phyllosphaerae]|uniref:Uncharacterized protein n=1 Tax=Paenibacillus phyllosphaerae TaxID=274593 RepID=A0A7W5B240_9BACL|nr:hypothetical protein [Paenibacillus phyllosphaerae]
MTNTLMIQRVNAGVTTKQSNVKRVHEGGRQAMTSTLMIQRVDTGATTQGKPY